MLHQTHSLVHFDFYQNKIKEILKNILFLFNVEKYIVSIRQIMLKNILFLFTPFEKYIVPFHQIILSVYMAILITI
jgi:hypothetical protein